jgi:hypothetical protein
MLGVPLFLDISMGTRAEGRRFAINSTGLQSMDA